MNDSFSSVQNIRSGLERENGCNIVKILINLFVYYWII